MSGRDLYSVTLNKAQIARVIEAHVLRIAGEQSHISLSAHAELPIQLTEVIVRVSEKRVRKPKAA